MSKPRNTGAYCYFNELMHQDNCSESSVGIKLQVEYSEQKSDNTRVASFSNLLKCVSFEKSNQLNKKSNMLIITWTVTNKLKFELYAITLTVLALKQARASNWLKSRLLAPCNTTPGWAPRKWSYRQTPLPLQHAAVVPHPLRFKHHNSCVFNGSRQAHLFRQMGSGCGQNCIPSDANGDLRGITGCGTLKLTYNRGKNHIGPLVVRFRCVRNHVNSD